MQKPCHLPKLPFIQVALHQLLEQFVTVQLADQGPGTVVIGDVGGVLGEKVAHDLVDGIVTLLIQSILNSVQNTAHVLLLIIGDRKLNGGVSRHVIDLLCILSLL